MLPVLLKDKKLEKKNKNQKPLNSLSILSKCPSPKRQLIVQQKMKELGGRGGSLEISRDKNLTF